MGAASESISRQWEDKTENSPGKKKRQARLDSHSPGKRGEPGSIATCNYYPVLTNTEEQKGGGIARTLTGLSKGRVVSLLSVPP